MGFRRASFGLIGTINVAFGEAATIGASRGTIGLKTPAAALFGGIGSLPGAFLGGLLVGLFEGLWSAYFGLAAREIALFALLVAVLVLRPGGLLGAAGPKPREI